MLLITEVSLLDQMLENTPAEQKAALIAFCASWAGFLHQYGIILYVHGFADFTQGFEAEWMRFQRSIEDAPE